jgi:hypothetical protein
VLVTLGCAKPSGSAPGAGKVVKIEAGPDAQKKAQTALINAKAGDVVEFGEGKFEFASTLSCDASDVTIRGAGNEELHHREPGRRGRQGRRD